VEAYIDGRRVMEKRKEWGVKNGTEI